MVVFAKRYNLRIVRVNMRDYPGSTPYSPAELDVLHNGSRDARIGFMKARGLELGAFITWFVRTEHVPAPNCALPSRADNGEQSSGLCLLAWSAGNCVALSLFAYAHLLPKQDQELLNQYLRSYIIFGTCLRPSVNVTFMPI